MCLLVPASALGNGEVATRTPLGLTRGGQIGDILGEPVEDASLVHAKSHPCPSDGCPVIQRIAAMKVGTAY